MERDAQDALFWSDAVCTDIGRFHQQTGHCVQMIMSRRRLGKKAEADFWFRRLLGARRFAEVEPFASSYDHAIAAAYQVLADWAVCGYEFDTAFRLAGTAWEILDLKDQRRAKARLAARPSTEVRVALIGTLADATWHAGEAFRDEVLSPERLYGLWRAASKRLREWIETGGEDEASVARVRDLLWAGIWVVASCRRYCPQRVMALTREFNVWHSEYFGGPSLALEPWHFQAQLPLESERPWYWMNEINKCWEHERTAKAEGRRRLTLDDLQGLYTRLLDAVEREAPGNRVLFDAFSRDYEWMRDRLRRADWEVLDFGRAAAGGSKWG